MSITLTLLATIAAINPAPTRGESYRQIYTDPAAFERADRNRDGQLSEDEFERFHDQNARNAGQRRLSGLSRGADLNNDGALTPDELYDEADLRLSSGNRGDDQRSGGRVDYNEPYDD